VLSPLTTSVTAQASDGGVTVTTTGSVNAAWTDSASGVVAFVDVGWTASNCPVSSCAAQLNLNPDLDWSYAFTADTDGTFTISWTVAADATTTDTTGLFGIGFYWDGVLQDVLRLADGNGTVSIPVQAGQTNTVGRTCPVLSAARHLNRCLAGSGRYTENPDRMEYYPMIFFRICQIMDEIHNLLPE
jgi:hypothetical protein